MNRSLLQKLRDGDSLDSIVNAILRSKRRVHLSEFRSTIDYIYAEWKKATNPHEKKVLRGAYYKLSHTFEYTFGEKYHNSLHHDIIQDIKDAQVIRRFKNG